MTLRRLIAQALASAIMFAAVCSALAQGLLSPGTASEDSMLRGGTTPGALFGTLEGTEFLHPDVAYVLSARAQDGRNVVVRWTIAEGYYLYRDKFKFALKTGPGIEVESVRIPPGEVKDDPYFGRVEVFYDSVEASISLQRPIGKQETKVMMDIGYQGCAEAGLCYPPITKSVPLALPAIPHTGGPR